MVNKTTPAELKKTAQAIASMLPYIVKGVHFGDIAQGSLTQTQFRVVVTLSLKGTCTMSEMASHMKVSMPTITGLVDRLAIAKYIKRKSHPKDRRQILIELMPKAYNFLKKFEKVYADRWEEILQILDQQETKQFLAIINKLNRGLEGQKS